MRPGVHGRFLGAPVEAVAPLVDETPQIVRGHAVAPVVVVEVVGPGDVVEATLQLVEPGLGDVDDELLG